MNDQKTLRTELKQISNPRFNAIRESYYKLAESIPILSDELEKADLENGGNAGPLLDEHFIMLEIMDILKRSNLGQCL